MTNLTFPCQPTTSCTSTNPCTTVCANDDVLGIGIRVNFYCTMVLLALIPQTPNTRELLNVLYANTGVAGLCLLVTAIQQTISGNLSLFHAIFVQHILFFLGIGLAPVGKYKWSRSRIAMGIAIQFLLVVAFTAWGVYMWADVKKFGSQPDLNDQVKYVLMFVNIRATASGLRGCWITALVVSALVLVITFGLNGLALYTMRHEEVSEETDESEREWYFYISYTQILTAIYSTVMLEIMVQRNSTQHGGSVEVDNNWAFGQTLSTVMVFANLNEVIHYLIGYVVRRRERSHERQGEAQHASNHTDVPLASASYRPRGPHLSAGDSYSEHELSNLNKENSQVHVTEITGVENPLVRDQPVGTLR